MYRADFDTADVNIDRPKCLRPALTQVDENQLSTLSKFFCLFYSKVQYVRLFGGSFSAARNLAPAAKLLGNLFLDIWWDKVVLLQIHAV